MIKFHHTNLFVNGSMAGQEKVFDPEHDRVCFHIAPSIKNVKWESTGETGTVITAAQHYTRMKFFLNDDHCVTFWALNGTTSEQATLAMLRLTLAENLGIKL